MSTLIHERVALARSGENPTVIGRMTSGWAVLGDSQFPPGYSLLLPDPVVGSINELSGPARGQFLLDMVALGDALLAVTGAYRINYELLGNADQALHAHVFARYSTEEPERKKTPVWMYDVAVRQSAPFDPAAHGPLRRALAQWLHERGILMGGVPA